ncbi:hypothetical protein BLNAU_9969 [Blattamonas nauphoetae]|uniref:Uncharacterized protein n=1 Tax=Blattamonas nauphoetae TaxID=2049346 RepID=A0ABQ9XU88_9EUKA|nr:hypothetical protein BLNAU_9969 [Blattamonas nauphoetae]
MNSRFDNDILSLTANVHPTRTLLLSQRYGDVLLTNGRNKLGLFDISSLFEPLNRHTWEMTRTNRNKPRTTQQRNVSPNLAGTFDDCVSKTDANICSTSAL